MAQIPYRYRLIILAIVDVIVLALVTVYGFATHGTLQTAGQRLPGNAAAGDHWLVLSRSIPWRL